jgi:hypothetical protein
MNRLRSLAILAVFVASPFSGLLAQADVETTYPSQITQIPDGARFAIVQAPYGAKGTFLLDRNLGTVWQLAGPGKDGLYIWQKVPVAPNKMDKREDESKPTYVLFVSGISLRFTFLMNIRTGASWQFANAEGEAVFAAMKTE